MYDQLLEIAQSFENINVKATPNFRAFIMLRDELELNEMDKDFAADVAACCDISFGEYTDEQLLAIIRPFAKMVDNVIEAFLEEGVSRDAVLTIVSKQFTMKCD